MVRSETRPLGGKARSSVPDMTRSATAGQDRQVGAERTSGVWRLMERLQAAAIVTVLNRQRQESCVRETGIPIPLRPVFARQGSCSGRRQAGRRESCAGRPRPRGRCPADCLHLLHPLERPWQAPDRCGLPWHRGLLSVAVASPQGAPRSRSTHESLRHLQWGM